MIWVILIDLCPCDPNELFQSIKMFYLITNYFKGISLEQASSEGSYVCHIYVHF